MHSVVGGGSAGCSAIVTFRHSKRPTPKELFAFLGASVDALGVDEEREMVGAISSTTRARLCEVVFAPRRHSNKKALDGGARSPLASSAATPTRRHCLTQTKPK
jgi:hypothetical protein